MTTLFDLPSTPDEFGVVLDSPDLRRLDFSGLDYDTSRRAIIEYIKTYFSDQFNDFVASNGVMMLVEIVAGVSAKLALRSDILVNESTFATALSEQAIVNHLSLINQRIKRQTPAIVDIEITVSQPVSTDIEIDAGTSFSIVGGDGKQIIYEVYRAPNDWTTKIVIPAGKRGVIAYGLEGQFSTPVTFVSNGDPNQKFVIQDDDVLELPLLVSIDGEEWTVIFDPIERYGVSDKVVEVYFVDDLVTFRFGDNLTGQIPRAGAVITVKYRVGGGLRGKIGVGVIDSSRQISPLPPSTAAVSVRFRNISASVGGTNRETVAQAKKRAPRDFSLQRSIVTANDYAHAAASFSHPVFGSVSKAVATIKSSLNANIVEIFVLANGQDNAPVAPSAGLKAGLATYIGDLHVLTNSIVISEGKLKPVDVSLNIIMNRSVDASVIKSKVESALDDFFDSSNWELGSSLYISRLSEVINRIDGISYVDLRSPLNNIILTGEKSVDGGDGVGFDELIVEGTRVVNYYYERTNQFSSSRRSL